MPFPLDLPWLLDDGYPHLELVEQLRSAGPDAREQIIATLLSAAEAEGGPGYNAVAAGLAAAGRVEDALDLLRETVAAFPDLLTARLNLATAYVETDQLRAALVELEQAVPYAVEDHERQMVEQRLDGLREWSHRYEWQVRLMTLRAAAIRERQAHGEAAPGETAALGNLLLDLCRLPGTGVEPTEAVAALEAARANAPDDVPVLEKLAGALTLVDDDGRLDEVLRRLEDLAPHSAVLRAFRPVGTSTPQLRERYGDWRTQVSRLIDDLAEGGERADTAFEELRSRARLHPHVPQYQIGEMMGYLQRDQLAEAVSIADRLVARPDAGHLEHFNAAQVYWNAGDDERAEASFRAAYDLAGNDEDRADVLAAIDMLAGRATDA